MYAARSADKAETQEALVSPRKQVFDCFRLVRINPLCAFLVMLGVDVQVC